MSLSQYLRLADVMARMSLRADAAKYFLGYIWWVLEPMLYVAVFYVVFAVILGTRQPDFLFFLMTGKLTFNWFSKSVTASSNSIVAGKGLVGKINVPKTLFPLAAVQEGMYKQLAVFAILIVILLVFGGFPVTITWVYLLPVLLVNYVLILACAFLGATLVCVVRDFQPMVSLAMIFLMFTSGVFWDPRGLGDPAKTEAVLTANPIAFMLDAYRQIMMHSTPPDMLHLLSIGAAFGALLCAMVLIMRRSSQFLALRTLTG